MPGRTVTSFMFSLLVEQQKGSECGLDHTLGQHAPLGACGQVLR